MNGLQYSVLLIKSLEVREKKLIMLCRPQNTINGNVALRTLRLARLVSGEGLFFKFSCFLFTLLHY